MQKLPPRDILLSLLRYEPESGELFWLVRGDAPWDARFAGRPALIAKHSSGYCSGALYGKQVYAHRVIWKMVHDEEPPVIDHLDGNRRHNALHNLRAATRKLNYAQPWPTLHKPVRGVRRLLASADIKVVRSIPLRGRQRFQVL